MFGNFLKPVFGLRSVGKSVTPIALIGVVGLLALVYGFDAQAELDRRLKQEIHSETGDFQNDLSVESDRIVSRDITDSGGFDQSGSGFDEPAFANTQKTIVEGAPLVESKSSRLRKRRQRLEIANEEKLVEKLEEGRLDDEKQRVKKIFGSTKFMQQSEKQYQPLDSKSPFHRTSSLEARPVAVAHSKIDSRLEKLEKAPLTQEKTNYLSGIFGLTEYGGAVNMENDIALGVAFGREMENRITVEGSFVYSSHNIRERSSFRGGGFGYQRGFGAFDGYPVFRDLEQYNFNVAGLYNFFEGALRPHAGVLAGYTYRKYSRKEFVDRRTNKEVTTDSIDVGLVLGLDVVVAENLSLGADYRWLTNVSNNNESDFYSAYNQYYSYGGNRFGGFSGYGGDGGDPVEEVDYSMLTLALKYRF